MSFRQVSRWKLQGSMFPPIVSNLFLSLPFVDFLDHLSDELSAADLSSMLIKTLLSGFFVGVISCYCGLTVRRTITDVPQRTIRAVGQCIVAVSAINVLVMVGYFIVEGV